jgi:hypothetical protein
MTNPMTNAPWWNLLFEIAALPAMNALLPFVAVGILALGLVALTRLFRHSQNHTPPAE